MNGMYVYELIDPKPVNKGGPLHGVTSKYITKSGIPVADRTPNRNMTTAKAVKAEPGMIVMDFMYGYNLYHIDADGDAHALNIKVDLVEHEFPENDVEADQLIGAIPRSTAPSPGKVQN